jgi:hypothetical protein
MHSKVIFLSIDFLFMQPTFLNNSHPLNYILMLPQSIINFIEFMIVAQLKISLFHNILQHFSKCHCTLLSNTLIFITNPQDPVIFKGL